MNYYLQGLQNYFNFNGRARRKEYWMFVLFHMIFAIVAAIVDSVTGLNFEPFPYGAIYMVYSLLMFIPGLSLTVRRLHDVGKSGWMILISFIPVFGAIYLFYLMCCNSNPGENDYGMNPKELALA